MFKRKRTKTPKSAMMHKDSPLWFIRRRSIWIYPWYDEHSWNALHLLPAITLNAASLFTTIHVPTPIFCIILIPRFNWYSVFMLQHPLCCCKSICFVHQLQVEAIEASFPEFCRSFVPIHVWTSSVLLQNSNTMD